MQRCSDGIARNENVNVLLPCTVYSLGALVLIHGKWQYADDMSAYIHGMPGCLYYPDIMVYSFSSHILHAKNWHFTCTYGLLTFIQTSNTHFLEALQCGFITVIMLLCIHNLQYCNCVIYRILSKISDTLIVRTPKYVIFSRSNCTGHGNFEEFPPL